MERNKGPRFPSAFRREMKNKDGNINCVSPWTSIIGSCWFSLKKKTKEEKNVVHENRSESHGQEEEEEDDDEIAESVHGGGSSSSLPCSELSGRRREVSFNLGVGFGIIYLIAASKHEFNKMVELSKQMETLIQHLKFPFQKNHYNSQPSNTSSSSEAREQERYCSSSPDVDGVDAKGKGNREKKMDQLEAELEVELEHLQVQLDSEVMANCEYITEISVEDSAPHEESSNNEYSEISFDEHPILDKFECSKSELNLNYNNNNDGVCPVELERKLHELLAMRQEEKIKALEYALDCAIQKLHQNQKQLSWWKDTATLVFQKISPH